MIPGRPASVRSRAFTLLEAVLAVAILAAVLVVCLGMRAQHMSSMRRVAEFHRAQRDAEAVFEMATANLLPAPKVEEESLVRTWTGDYLGEAYVLTARPIAQPNPVVLTDRTVKLAPVLYLWKYELAYRGRTTEFLWNR